VKALTEKGSTHEEIKEIMVEIDKNVKIFNTICKMIE
jgi:hypothetical protein